MTPARQMNHPWLKLLLTCKQIYEEAAPICQQAGRLNIYLQNDWVSNDALMGVLTHLGAPEPACRGISLIAPSAESLRFVRLNICLDSEASAEDSDAVMGRFDFKPLNLLPNLRVLSVSFAGSYAFDEPLRTRLLWELVFGFEEKVRIVGSKWPISGFEAMSQDQKTFAHYECVNDWSDAHCRFESIMHYMQTGDETELEDDEEDD